MNERLSQQRKLTWQHLFGIYLNAAIVLILVMAGVTEIVMDQNVLGAFISAAAAAVGVTYIVWALTNTRDDDEPGES